VSALLACLDVAAGPLLWLYVPSSDTASDAYVEAVKTAGSDSFFDGFKIITACGDKHTSDDDDGPPFMAIAEQISDQLGLSAKLNAAAVVDHRKYTLAADDAADFGLPVFLEELKAGRLEVLTRGTAHAPRPAAGTIAEPATTAKGRCWIWMLPPLR
jgi:hypothetical protein